MRIRHLACGPRRWPRGLGLLVGGRRLSVNVNVNVAPPVVLASPPKLVVVPNSPV